MISNEISSILVLALMTIVSAVCTFLGIRWWTGQKGELARFNQWIQIGLSWIVIAVVIVVPMFFLCILMDKLHIGGEGNALVLFCWIMPSGIFMISYLFRKKGPN
jgi:hypothetical protein